MRTNSGKAYYSYRPLHRSVRVTRAETLAEADPQKSAQQLVPNRTPHQLSEDTLLYISRFLVIEPFTAADNVKEEPESKSNESAQPKRVTLADFTKNVGIGAGLAVPPLTVIPVANATTPSELAAQLTGYGFTPNASDQMASTAVDFARSHLGQFSCVFLAGSAVTIGTVEAFKPHWTWKRKLLVAAIGGLAAVLLAAILTFLGIWGQSAELSANHSPADPQQLR